MSERPLIEEAMKRLAEAQPGTGSPDALAPPPADGDADGRASTGRRSYDEALAWRRAQLAAALGEAPSTERQPRPAERRTAARRRDTSLGRRDHELDALGQTIAPVQVPARGFTLAELIGTGVVCAVASAAISSALFLTHGPGLVTTALPGKALLVDRATVFPAPLVDAAADAKTPPFPAPAASTASGTAAPLVPLPAAVEVAPPAAVAVQAGTPTAAPFAAAISGFDEAAVRAAVENWRAAWSAVDADRYLATYAPDFVSDDGLSGAAWAESRRSNFARKAQIDVQVGRLVLAAVDADHFEARFTQDYSAGRYRERGTRKTLLLSRTPDGWRISAERQQR